VRATPKTAARCVALTVPVLAAITAFARPSVERADPARLAAEAQAAARAGNYAAAISGFEKLIQIAPDVAEVHADLAVAYYFSGRYGDAARECHTALRLKPGLTYAHNFLGPSLAESGDCRDAVPYLQKDYSRVADPQLRRILGTDTLRCALTLHQPESVLEMTQALTREFPRDPEVLYLASHVYSELSTEASERLLAVAPDSYQAHQFNAEVLELEGKTADAIEEYRKVLALNPHRGGIHYELGRLLLERSPDASNLAAAQREFEEELKIEPESAAAEYQLGEMARQARRWDEAIGHFQRAIRSDPQFAAAYVGLGGALISAGRPSEAVAPLERAVRLQPGNPDAHYQLSFAYRHAGRDRDAERELAAYRRAHDALMGERQRVRTGINGQLTDPRDVPGAK
jgi:tetratricopeptide (TPR) repeat protein